MTGSISTVERFVRSLDGEFYLQREVAAALNCSVRTLVAVRDEDPERNGPSYAVRYQGLQICLYSLDDVHRLQEVFARRHPELTTDATATTPFRPGRSKASRGRPALFDPHEVRERQARHSKAGYWAARAKRYRQKDRAELAAAAQARCDCIRDQLRAEYEVRTGVLTLDPDSQFNLVVI